jgi:hypothetical protein
MAIGFADDQRRQQLDDIHVVQLHKFPGPAWDVVSDIGRMMLTRRAR